MDDRNMVIVAAKAEYESAGPGSFLQKLTAKSVFVADALRQKGLSPLSDSEREALGEVVVAKAK